MGTTESLRSRNRKVWGCPRTKNRSSWCNALCVPDNGLGDCGRIAAHGLMGRTQLAIQSKKSRAAA